MRRLFVAETRFLWHPALGSAIPISDAERTSWGRKGRAWRRRGQPSRGEPSRAEGSRRDGGPASRPPVPPSAVLPACARSPAHLLRSGLCAPRVCAACSEIEVAFKPTAIRRVLAANPQRVKMHIFVAPEKVVPLPSQSLTLVLILSSVTGSARWRTSCKRTHAVCSPLCRLLVGSIMPVTSVRVTKCIGSVSAFCSFVFSASRRMNKPWIVYPFSFR